MTFVTCGNCGSRVAVTALSNHAEECLRRAFAKVIEAQRADTPKSESVEDESAVAKAICPERDSMTPKGSV